MSKTSLDFGIFCSEESALSRPHILIADLLGIKSKEGMVRDLCLVDYNPFFVFLGLLPLNFRFVLEFFTYFILKHSKFRLFLQSFQIQKKH